MNERVYEIHFDALRNAIYHTARKGFLDRLNRILSFVIVLAGTSAVGDLAHQIFPNGGVFVTMQFSAAVAALAGTAQLVFDFGGAARAHEFLQYQYYELVAKLLANKEPSDEEISMWETELHLLYAKETPSMRALDSIAYNSALESLKTADKSEEKRDYRIQIKWYHTVLAQLLQFNNSEFPWMKDVKKRHNWWSRFVRT